jgi:hypothetical protein
LNAAGAITILQGPDVMTPTILLVISLSIAVLVLFYAVRAVSRHAGKTFDLGVVSTRWLSELRRDEPWTRS